MAQYTVDLSGQAGLAPTFAGDLNSTTSSPQLRYIGQSGQLAEGVFDPLRVQGFMSPANNTFTALSGTITNKFVSSEYSASADTIYLGQNGTVLSTISGLDGTSISNTTTLTGQSVFRDLEMYMINGQESLFYSYLYADSSVTNQSKLAVGFKSVDSTKGAFELAAQVLATGVPTDVAGIADGTAASSDARYNRQKLSQRFRTQDFSISGDPKVSGVRLCLLMPFVGTAQTWTLKVGIQTDSSGKPSGSYVTNASTTLAASLLPSGSDITSTHPTGDFAYVWFQFPATVTLSASTVYHLVIEPTVAAASLGANQGVRWLMSDVADNQYANGLAEWYTIGIKADADDATNVLTITDPTTLAVAEVVNGTALKYIDITHGGLTQNTTYYVGTVSGQTFKLYTDDTLSVLVDITVSMSSIRFEEVATYPNIAFTSITSGVTATGSVTFNSGSAGTATNRMAVVVTNTGATSITWDGVAMTKVLTGASSHTVWMLAAPPTGVSSVIVTGSNANTVAYAITYQHADQTLALDSDTDTGTAGAVGDITKSITVVARSLVNFVVWAGTSKSFYSPTFPLILRDGTATIADNDFSEATTNGPAVAGSHSYTMTRDAGGTGSVSSLLFALKQEANVTQINTGYYNSEAASFDFALILNQYNNLIGSVIQAPVNVFDENNDDNVFLHNAQNGFLYLFTNNRVSKFDGGDTGGNTGTFTPDVLTFPTYINTIDAVDINSLVYIAIESSDLQTSEARTFPANQIGVYAWDYQSVLSSIRNYYPAPGARNIKRLFLTTEGALRLITIGEDGFAEVRGFLGGQYQVMFKMGRKSYPNRRDSFGYMNNMITWLGADGYMYLLGKIRPDTNESLYRIGNLNTAATGTLTPGIICMGNKTTTQSRDGIFITYDDTSPAANKIVHWYPHGTGTINSVDQKGNSGDIYTLNLRFPSATSVQGTVDPVTLAKVHYVRFYHAPVGTTSTTVKGTISTYLNQSSTPVRVDNVTSADIVKGYQYINLGQALLSGVFMIQFKLQWSTTETLSTTADWMPRLLEMNYEEITKRF